MSSAHDAASTDPLIGSRIDGRYTVYAVLGQGGMGVVYEGVHDELGRQVAIKVLNAAWATDPTAVERFLREARTASSFSHSNIVDVMDLGRLSDGRPYLVMPKIAGIDLATLLSDTGPQPAKRVAALLSGVASALDLVHAKGYVHRDIKPENLMYVVREDGSETVMLLDFGIAAAVMSSGPRLTRQGAIFGTPQYMPPEVCAGGRPDARGDVYALAGVAFELITGALLFPIDDIMQLMTMKVTTDAPTLAAASGTTFPPELEAVIARGLARNPQDRYPSASSFVNALRSATEYAPVSWQSGVLRSSLHSEEHMVPTAYASARPWPAPGTPQVPSQRPGSWAAENAYADRSSPSQPYREPSNPYNQPQHDRSSPSRPYRERGATPRDPSNVGPTYSGSQHPGESRPSSNRVGRVSDRPQGQQEDWRQQSGFPDDFGPGPRTNEHRLRVLDERRFRTEEVPRRSSPVGRYVLGTLAGGFLVIGGLQFWSGVNDRPGATAASDGVAQSSMSRPGAIVPGPLQAAEAKPSRLPGATESVTSAVSHAPQPPVEAPINKAEAAPTAPAATAEVPTVVSAKPADAPAPGRGSNGRKQRDSSGAWTAPVARNVPSPGFEPPAPEDPSAAAADPTPSPAPPTAEELPSAPTVNDTTRAAAPVLTLKPDDSVVEQAQPSEAQQAATQQAPILTRDASSALLRGEVSHAVELARRATTQDPSYALGWRTLGLALERAGSSVDAVSAYSQYLQRAPTGPQADMVRQRMQALGR
jgi:serine/threonine-protein kinase